MRRVIEGVRIFLRPFVQEDTDAVYAYRSLPEVARYQYWEPYSHEDAAKFVEECTRIGFGSRGEWTGLVIVRREDNKTIGDCALNLEATKAEVGFNIAPAFQRMGFGREMLRLLIDYCFGQLGIQEVYGITDADNVASIRLMESAGMMRDKSFERTIPFKGALSTEHRYQLIRK